MRADFVNSNGEHGAALVLTLAILVIATILVVGFATNMRTERQASTSMANNQIASLLADAAISHAIAILDKNIPQPVPPGGSTANPTNWIINPGLLTTVQGTSSLTQIPLSSNPNATYASTAQDAELNIPQLSGSGYTIASTAVPMRVAWIPVLQDATRAASSTNKITGRYAFWMDDESAKINLNTAVGKPATMDFTKLTPGVINVGSANYPLGHPSSVNLDVLGTVNTTSLDTAIAHQWGLASIDAIKPHVPNGTGDAFLNANKFFLTASSRDPEFNVFGKSRLYFLRKATGQLGYPIFQFFRDREGPPYFPIDESSAADRHAAYYAAAAISAYLNRNDWPGMPARSFVDKWDKDSSGNPYPGLKAGEMGKREADQVAWNLIAMGNFAAGDYSGTTASSQYFQLANATKSTETGFVSKNKPNTDILTGSLSGKAMLPQFPVPLINEVGLVISPEYYTLKSGEARYHLKASITLEVWIPPGYPTYDFASSQLSFGATYLYYNVTQKPNTVASQEDAGYLASANPNGVQAFYSTLDSSAGVASPGQYLQVVTTFPIYLLDNVKGFHKDDSFAKDFLPTGVISFDFKMRLYAKGPNATIQLLPVWDTRDPRTATANTTWNSNPSQSGFSTLSPPADDPNDFIEFKFDLDPEQFGASPEPYTRSLEVADPRIGSLARTWQQAPKFTDQSEHNASSLGAINNATTAAGYDTKKLAYVDLTAPGPSSNRPSTGVLSFLATGMQRGIAGANLKFQPSVSATDVPDWLMLDLVAPNAITTGYPAMSYMNSTAGKINVNATIYPNAGSFTPPQRWQPLQAVFENMPGVSSGTTSAATVVTNILNHTLAAGAQDFGAPGIHDYVGEICEIAGVADSATATDWDKEVLIRNLASTITTKSNVFSVWGVAQTVKKNPANNTPTNQGFFESKAAGAAADDSVTGEKRFQAIIERYVWPGVDAIPGEGHVNAGAYDKLSSGQTKPGYPPPYSGGTWETIDGPDSPTYPVAPNTDPWATSAPNYTSSTLDAANNPARAMMKYRVIYFRFLSD